MKEIDLSIIIPTYNRPELLPRAVKSALAQQIDNFEVLVIDDGSTSLTSLPEDDKLRVIRLESNQGGAAARNQGAKLARGHWLTYLDDDDVLLPDMAQKATEAIANIPSSLPAPVAILFGLKIINSQGEVKETHLPPTLAKGSHFCLEEIPSDRSFFSKQTLVIEKDIFLAMGGFDPNFTSRVHTELFLRLNPVCSLWGIPEVTYHLSAHEGNRVSSNPQKRQKNFEKLLQKHHHLFVTHSRQKYADFVFNHADMLQRSGQNGLAIKALGQALSIDPVQTIARLGSPYKQKLVKTLLLLKKRFLELN